MSLHYLHRFMIMKTPLRIRFCVGVLPIDGDYGVYEFQGAGILK